MDPRHPYTHAVLVVDDDPEMTETLALVLGDAGYRVTAAASGEEALAAIEREVPDVVVTDLSMPGMNGLDLVEAAHRRHPEVPFILLTAFGDWPSFCRARELGIGCDCYLTKPVAMDELLARVEAMA